MRRKNSYIHSSKNRRNDISPQKIQRICGNTTNKQNLRKKLINPFVNKSALESLQRISSSRKNYLNSVNVIQGQRKSIDGRVTSCSQSMIRNWSSSSGIFKPLSHQISKDQRERIKFHKQFQITRNEIKLFGPEIIRYQISPISVQKQYYNEPIHNEKYNLKQAKNINREATTEYFFVKKNQNSHIQQQYKKKCGQVKKQNKCQKFKREEKENLNKIQVKTVKSKFKLKKSLSWNTQLCDYDQNKDTEERLKIITEKSIENSRPISYPQFDQIVSECSFDEQNMIKSGSMNPLKYGSNGMETLSKQFPLNSSQVSFKMNSLSSYERQNTNIFSQSNNSNGGGIFQANTKNLESYRDSKDFSKSSRFKKKEQLRKPQTLFYDRQIYYNLPV